MLKRSLAPIALFTLFVTRASLAQEFPDGPSHPTCPDDFKTGAIIRVTDLFGSRLTVSNLTDLHTLIGRSDPFIESDLADLGAAICSAGSAPFPNTQAIVGDSPLQPVGFPTGSATRRQVHTEILSLNLSDGAVSIKAGQAYYDAVNPGGVPSPQSRFYRNSTGEVVSLYSGTPVDLSQDFPAASYFNVFVQVSIPALNLKLYNKTPLLVSTTITEFPPKLNLPNSEYVHDPTFAVPLFDDNGLPFGWLLSAGHGSSTPMAFSLAPDAAYAMPCPVSFCVEAGSLGINPTVTGVTPNHVFADTTSSVKPLNVYCSSSAAAPGSAPDMSNVRSLAASVGVLPAFAVGDVTNSMSFGRDGTRFTAPCCTPHAGALFFSVSRASRGVLNTQINANATLSVSEAAADVYMSGVGPFGRYADMGTAGTPTNDHALATDSTQLGLRPDISAPVQDNVTALELHAFDPSAPDHLYGTYRGASFGSNAATIFVYDSGSGPFRRGNLVSFAAASTMGLVPSDVIDALALSDVTNTSCPASPNQVLDPGLDEVLFSLAPGSPSLLGPDLAPGLIGVDDDGVNGIDDIGETGLGDDKSPATVFSSSFTGSNAVFALPQALGLLNNDDVDAIDIKPGEADTCTIPPVFCLGDTAALCPCNTPGGSGIPNPGSPGHGCGNSIFPAGVLLAQGGTASTTNDSLVLTCTNLTGPSAFFQSNGLIGPFPYGDGLLCAGAGVIRLGVVFPFQGVATYPGGTTPNPISIAGAPISPGQIRHYQTFYRDISAGFCTPGTSNMSNGVTIVWQ